VAQHRALAAGQDCAKPPALLAETRVADGIDTPVDSVEATRLDATSHGALGHAGRDQLGKQDDPMLTCREHRDLEIGVLGGAFRTHMV
jgi:hypothetical protein